jgi:hypothetical protein
MFVSVMNFFSLFLALGMVKKIASTYLIFYLVTSLQISLLYNAIADTFYLRRMKSYTLGILKSSRVCDIERYKDSASDVIHQSRILFSTYIVALFLPCLYTTSFGISVFNFFVPLTGRIGPDAPIEFIIATLVGLFVFLGYHCLIPLMYHKSSSAPSLKTNASMNQRNNSYLGWILFITQILSIGWFSFFSGDVYDTMHPQRAFIQHWRNISMPVGGIDEALYVAQSDPGPFENSVIKPIALSLDHYFSALIGKDVPDSSWELQTKSDSYREFDSLYPFTHFLNVYRIPIALSTMKSTVSKDYRSRIGLRNPAIALIDSGVGVDQDDVSYRWIEIECQHADFMYTIISFEAHVLEWNLHGILKGKSAVNDNQDSESQVWQWNHSRDLYNSSSKVSEEFVTYTGHSADNGILKPFPRRTRYVIRHPSGYGSEVWRMRMKYVMQGSDTSDFTPLKISLTGVSGENTIPSHKEQRHWQVTDKNPILQAISLDIPDFVQPMMLDVVGGDVYV